MKPVSFYSMLSNTINGLLHFKSPSFHKLELSCYYPEQYKLKKTQKSSTIMTVNDSQRATKSNGKQNEKEMLKSS